MLVGYIHVDAAQFNKAVLQKVNHFEIVLVVLARVLDKGKVDTLDAQVKEWVWVQDGHFANQQKWTESHKLNLVTK